MRNKIVKKLVLAGILLAITIVMVILKNISAYISGPIINTVIIIATLELGLPYGIGFAIVTPLLSLLLTPAAPMTMLIYATDFTVSGIIILGNIVYLLIARIGKNRKFWFLLVCLIVGVLAKWGVMTFGGEVILKKFYIDALGPQTPIIINTVFSTLQLITGAISIPLILAIDKLILRRKH